MDIQNALLVISAALVVVFTAIVSRPGMTPGRKRLIAGIFSFVLGTITAVVNGQIEGIPPEFIAWLVKVLVTVAVVIVASQGIYQLFKDSLSTLEASVNVGPDKQQAVVSEAARTEPAAPGDEHVTQALTE